MDTPNKKEEPVRTDYRRRGGKSTAGLIVVIVGLVLLLRQTTLPIPGWIFTWPMILIAVGFFIGARRNFAGFGWAIPMLLGVAFLLHEIYPWLYLHEYVWPVILIVIGLLIMFGSGHRGNYRRRMRYRRPEISGPGATSPEDTLSVTAIFGAQEKNLVSKDFKGGETTSIFGGSSLNFRQADMQHDAVLGITQIFGGLELIVPPHWDVQSEVTTVFGGIQDTRSYHEESASTPKKRLVLRGTVIFGGIEIKD